MFSDDGNLNQTNSKKCKTTHNKVQVFILNVDLAEKPMFIFGIHPRLES